MIETSRRGSGLTIDQQLALRTATVALQREFHGIFDPATVERVLFTSHDQVGGDSAITRFMRAERFARKQLQALARLRGHPSLEGKPLVLFLDQHNASRSPMAVGFLRHLTDDNAVAWSGGTQPSDEINHTAVAAMHERGIDITSEFPKPWTHDIIHAADIVIILGCQHSHPALPGKPHRNWQIDYPTSLSLDAVREIRDGIEQHVQTLIDELGLSIRSQPASPHTLRTDTSDPSGSGLQAASPRRRMARGQRS